VSDVDPRLVAVIEKALTNTDWRAQPRKMVAERIAADVWAWLAEGDPT
jgi:hypothetical protein